MKTGCASKYSTVRNGMRLTIGQTGAMGKTHELGTRYWVKIEYQDRHGTLHIIEKPVPDDLHQSKEIESLLAWFANEMTVLVLERNRHLES